MARIWRSYHPNASEAAPGLLTLLSEEGHHVRRVLRLRAGDRLAVFDGRGGEWQAELVECDARQVTVRLADPISRLVESPLRIVLHQVECRPESMDWLVQKSTELGVWALVVVNLPGTPQLKGDARLRRWERIAIEAAKQCGRMRLPLLERRSTLVRPDGAGVLALLLDPSADAPALGAVARGAPCPTEVWLAVGPESGFDEDLVVAAETGGWSRVSVGPRILRAETAGVVAVTLAQHLFGDLGGSAMLAAPARRP